MPKLLKVQKARSFVNEENEEVCYLCHKKMRKKQKVFLEELEKNTHIFCGVKYYEYKNARKW